MRCSNCGFYLRHCKKSIFFYIKEKERKKRMCESNVKTVRNVTYNYDFTIMISYLLI